jgi:hypothetical protein
MNVEIRAEAAQFPEKEYINGIFFLAVCMYIINEEFEHFQIQIALVVLLFLSKGRIRVRIRNRTQDMDKFLPIRQGPDPNPDPDPLLCRSATAATFKWNATAVF